jgi:PAS domain S-box-containing protein
MNGPDESPAGTSFLSLSAVVRVAAAIGALVGVGVLTGWFLEIPWLRSGFGSGSAVNPATSVFFLLLAISLWTSGGDGARRAGSLAAAAAILAAGLVLLAPLLGIPRGFDLAPVRSRLETLGSAAPRPTNAGSAILFLMLSAGLLLVRRRSETWRLVGRSIGLLIAILGLLSIVTAVVRLVRGTAGTASGFGTLAGLTALGVGLASAGSRRSAAEEADEPGGLRLRVRLALSVAVGILVATCGLGLWTTIRSLQADAGQKQGVLRRAHLAGLLGALQDAEVGQQGYLLTGDPKLLERYRTALGRIPGAVDSAGRDTLLARRLAILRPLVEERLGFLERTIELKDSGRVGEATDIVGAGEGRALMDRIQAAVAGMTADEDSLAAGWTARVRTASQISVVTIFFAGLLTICFLILAGRTINRDFEERSRIEAERDRFFTLSLDMLCIAKSDGYFKRINPSFTSTLGWEVEELLARPFLDFVHPDDRAATLQEVARQTVAGEPVLGFQNRYLHKDGSYRVLSWRSVPQPGGLMFATARDVTDMQRAETVLRAAKDAADVANRAKSDFLAKMSHELRTPLNSIIGFSEILETESAGALNEKQRRYVANVLVSGRNLLQLINDILDLSKVEAGRMELAPAPFAVEHALEQVREMVAPLADKKRLALELVLPDTLPPVHADEAKLKQILFNLLSNAIKFTPEGGRVTMSAVSMPGTGNGSPHAHGEVQIAVSDTGIGIAPENLDRIFKEFEQVGADSNRHSQGTGLGLALTRKLVELHGGRVSVESRPGEGSVFRFTLPCAAPDASAPGQPQVATPSEVAGPAMPLVLVVDDDPRSRDLISHYLEQSGYRAASAATALEAMQRARELKPDAITLDLILPDREGLLVLAELKSDPDTRRIPVVVVSVTGRSELGFSLGAEDWLVKPVQKEVFLRSLEAATASRGSREKRTILVVDDDPAAVEYVSELVRHRGCEVLTASNGREGVRLALRHQPDAIILDLCMPGMNGFEAVKALRANSGTRATPILIVTAKDLTLEERQQLQASVQGIVSKGWRTELLTELARLCHLAEAAI